MEKRSEAAVARVYEEFEPLTRWTSEPGFDTLIVYLPAFKKEQLKVQVTSSRKLRVLGERPAGGNKWIRFRKEFPLSSNLDVDAISAKFEGVNLYVKLPKLERRGANETKTSPIGGAKPQVQPPQLQPRSQKTENGQTSMTTDQKLKAADVPQRQTNGAQKPDAAAQQVPPSKASADKGDEKERIINGRETVKEKETQTGNEKRASESDAAPHESKKHEGVAGDSARKGQKMENQAKGSRDYKQVIGGLVTELKSRRKITIRLAVAAAVVLGLGLYVNTRCRCSIAESEG